MLRTAWEPRHGICQGQARKMFLESPPAFSFKEQEANSIDLEHSTTGHSRLT